VPLALTDAQQRHYRDVSQRMRKNPRGNAGIMAAALVIAAVGLVRGMDVKPGTSAPLPALIAVAFIVVAAFAMFRLIRKGGALARDLRHVRVQSTEGAIGKREGPGMAALARPDPVPPEHRDPRPLGDAIAGTWTNGVMTVAFSRDGTVTVTTLGHGEWRGHWSVDASGRLHSDVTGQQDAADAWVAGDRLTIAAEAGGLSFSRAGA
jgi:hypothetical protein